MAQTPCRTKNTPPPRPSPFGCLNRTEFLNFHRNSSQLHEVLTWSAPPALTRKNIFNFALRVYSGVCMVVSLGSGTDRVMRLVCFHPCVHVQSLLQIHWYMYLNRWFSLFWVYINSSHCCTNYDFMVASKGKWMKRIYVSICISNCMLKGFNQMLNLN